MSDSPWAGDRQIPLQQPEQEKFRGDVPFDELENEMAYIQFDSGSALKDDLNAFVKKLDVESQTLFMRRYFLGESVSSLASRFEMSEDNVGVKLFRIRAKLKKYLTGKGYDL